MGITDRHVDANPQTMMTATARVKYGPVKNVQLIQLPRPKVTEHGVPVQVHAAGLDRGVWHLTTGLPYLARLVFGFRRPKNPVLGMDFAGTVLAVGASVTRLSVGDVVYGMKRQLRALVLSPFLRQRMTTFTGAVHTRDLEELNEFFRTGTVTPTLEKTYPLDQVPEALEYLTAGKIRGKVGITL